VTDFSLLTRLGWQPFFQQQLLLDEWDNAEPARIVEQHKSVIEVAKAGSEISLPMLPSMPPLAVGDWILLSTDDQFSRVLERKSCFRRMAAGTRVAEQLIAANVDTAFIVCSLNEDFNLSRIERYLSVTHDAGSEAVVVLSKRDMCAADEADGLRDQVQQLDRLLCVEMVNCLDAGSVAVLLPWCKPGQTVVMLGSSGSGKSTLSNRLAGADLQLTGAIRADDDKGRHTTTRRSLLSTPDGALLLDTPGMRELQLATGEEAIAATFADIEALATACRFVDCQHGEEPGCAVNSALETGELDQRRLANYQKLSREQAHNAASLAQRHASDRELGRYIKRVQREAKQFKRGR
jgi:ribosome biogenesis GTPase